MDRTIVIIRTVIMIAGLIGAVVLLFIGFRGTTKALKKDDATQTVPREVLIRSTVYLVCALLCVVASYAAMHFNEYQEGACTLSQLILGCLISVLRSFGWIVLIPWLLNLFRKTSPHKN